MRNKADLKSTNEVQLRLRQEFSKTLDGKYELEIKRGQNQAAGTILITNEEAGRLLLAFDLMEPESCHQVYKLFDDKYSEIFARPAVTAFRIILLKQIMDRIEAVTPDIAFKPLSKYGLTRFFLLSAAADLIRKDEFGNGVLKDPMSLFQTGRDEKFLGVIEEIMRSIVVDLNFEVDERGDQFDYKGDLKSPNKIRELRAALLRSYEKDVARKKAPSLSDVMAT